MSIGEYKYLVNLQSYSTSRNDVGESEKTWSTYSTAWASIKTISSSNYESGNQEDSELTHRIRVRYNGTITSEDRVEYNSKFYEIVEVIDTNTKFLYISLKAKQITDATN